MKSLSRLLLVWFLALVALPARPSTAQTDRDWQDVLAGVDLSQHVVAGNWSRGEAGWRTDAAISSRAFLPVQVPREYDLQVEFTRHTGQHSVAIFFTSGSGIATFEIDAWSQHLAGIQLIGGEDCRRNSTRVENQVLQNNRRYKAEVRVRKDQVTAILDGKVLATYRGDGSDLSLVPLWSLPKQARIGIGAYDAETTFHRVLVRGVSGQPTFDSSKVAMNRSEPPGSSERPAGSRQPAETRPASTSVATGDRGRVLIVIADDHFFYREYADPREELERAGFVVEVAAGDRRECFPHANSGQSGGGGVTPDFALSEVDPSRYDALVFSGGWGASMYQFAFPGRYDNTSYNGDARKKRAANELINAFASQDKYICGICNGVSVLAWSRVDGQSLLAGKSCTAPTRAAPSGTFNGRRGSPSIRWHVEQNQGRLVPAGSIGNPNSRADDVVVDGKLITAEDDQSARQAGRRLAQLLRD